MHLAILQRRSVSKMKRSGVKEELWSNTEEEGKGGYY
jgi:hypothetical protein